MPLFARLLQFIAKSISLIAWCRFASLILSGFLRLFWCLPSRCFPFLVAGSRDTVSYQPFVSIPLDIATTYVASGGRRDHETADRGCESASATADASDPADEWVTIKPSKASAKAAAVAAPAPTHSVAATVDASDPCLSVDDALAAFMCTEPLYGFKNPGSSQVLYQQSTCRPSLPQHLQSPRIYRPLNHPL